MTERKGATVLVAVALVVLVVPACSDSEPSTSADTTTTSGRPEPGYTPTYAEVDCTAPEFAGRFETDPPLERLADIDCGTLTVPEDRADPDGREVVLPVAILRSTAPDRKPDPYVYFSGGPGGPGIEDGVGLLEYGLVPTDRDFIWFDQRGTGRSTPSLSCPVTTEDLLHRYETTDSAAVEDDATLAAHRECLAALREVADLDQYDTPTTAQDVADLRTALGLEEWNIFGVSYGTTVALEVLRAHPEGVRSAVIDSVYPPTTDPSVEPFLDLGVAALDRLVAGCERDATCGARYPTLDTDIEELVAALDASPYRLEYVDLNGKQRVANLTGQDVVAAAFQAMYDSSLIPLIPSFIDLLHDGIYAPLDLVGERMLGVLGANADGQTSAVECADRAEIMTEGDVEELRLEEPLFQQFLGLPRYPAMCEEADVEPVADSFRDIPETDVPTLVMLGEYDPITPPADGERTADRLGERATAVVFPATGHGSTTVAGCPQDIFWAFLDDPSAPVDTSCVAAMGPPAWA